VNKQEAVDAARAEMRVGGRPVKRVIELTRQLAVDGVSLPASVTSEVLENLEERICRLERIQASTRGRKPKSPDPEPAAA